LKRIRDDRKEKRYRQREEERHGKPEKERVRLCRRRRGTKTGIGGCCVGGG